MHYCDLTDPTNLIRIIQETQPAQKDTEKSKDVLYSL